MGFSAFVFFFLLFLRLFINNNIFIILCYNIIIIVSFCFLIRVRWARQRKRTHTARQSARIARMKRDNGRFSRTPRTNVAAFGATTVDWKSDDNHPSPSTPPRPNVSFPKSFFLEVRFFLLREINHFSPVVIIRFPCLISRLSVVYYWSFIICKLFIKYHVHTPKNWI